MSEQLALIDIPPVLTDRQQVAFNAIARSGYDGLHTDELGAAVHAWQHRHGEDERCQFCGSVAMELGRALRAKGYVQQRRRRMPGGDQVTVWTVSGKLERPDVRPSAQTNDFPEGF